MKKSTRLVFTKWLRNNVADRDKAEILHADEVVDEALDNLEFEEPSMREWLQKDPELRSIYKATFSTMYTMVVKDLMNDIPLNEAFERANPLMFRTIAAIAHKAALRERESYSDKVW